jgi:hypothetical protein
MYGLFVMVIKSPLSVLKFAAIVPAGSDDVTFAFVSLPPSLSSLQDVEHRQNVIANIIAINSIFFIGFGFLGVTRLCNCIKDKFK